MSQTDIHVANAASMSQDDARYLISLIRTVPDFPREGILFRDFMPVFADSRGLRILLDALIAALPVHTDEFDAVAGLEARGFLFGPALPHNSARDSLPFARPGSCLHRCMHAAMHSNTAKPPWRSKTPVSETMNVYSLSMT